MHYLKYSFSLFVFLLLLSACRESPKTTAPVTIGPPPAPVFDTLAETIQVTAAVRGFFGWYGHFMQSPAFGNERFMDDSGKHYKLKPVELEGYLTEFLTGGFAGQEFLQREKAFYRRCEKYWQKESKEDIPTGLDADHYLCAQEDMTSYYINAPLKVKFTTPNRATATLSLDDDTFKNTLNVYMAKENDKWLYAGTECDMGVK